MLQVLSVQVGFGVDFHGQSPTVSLLCPLCAKLHAYKRRLRLPERAACAVPTQIAAIKAVNNAMDTTSLPAILEFVPGGIDGVKVKAKISTPNPVGAAVHVAAARQSCSAVAARGTLELFWCLLTIICSSRQGLIQMDSREGEGAASACCA